jgi:hypothetical protein
MDRSLAWGQRTMKTLFTLMLALCFAGWPALASTPTDISFAAKKTTLMGSQYHVYNVRCSDGSRQQISAWDNKQKWCAGLKDNHCFPTQLKAASAVCK